MSEESVASPLGTGTAPGKVILLGEHAVVYGQPAVALPVTAVEARATVWPADRPLTIHAYLPQREGAGERVLDVTGAAADDALAAAARATLAHLRRTDVPAWWVDLASTVPTGRGMGSSAAIAVALVRALAHAAGTELDAPTASALAYESEKVTHGTPSGIDNSVVALGRPLRFARGIATGIAIGQPLTLLVADTGLPGATRAMVAGVRARRAERPEAYDDWFARIGHMAEEAVPVLARGDLARLGRLMNANHLVLQAMRVSTPGLDRIVGAARLAGALGAKVSGAGGGGVAIALVSPTTAAAVTEACLEAGAVQVLRTLVEATS